MGRGWLHRKVVRPCAVAVSTRTPLAIAVTPVGTVIVKSKPALSRGVSLQGYQDGEPCGSLTTKAPVSVGPQPSMEPSGSVTGLGTPEYRTTTVNSALGASGTAGVMTSSCRRSA